jgi:DNA-binding transcriptional ArsR family regulator
MRSDRLGSTFAALADPTRRAILGRLACREMSVKELAKPFTISPPAITKHLKVLERAGLITRGREAQWRPCRLNSAPLKDVADWVEQYRQHWDERLDRLDTYLREFQRRQPAAKGKKRDQRR